MFDKFDWDKFNRNFSEASKLVAIVTFVYLLYVMTP